MAKKLKCNVYEIHIARGSQVIGDHIRYHIAAQDDALARQAALRLDNKNNKGIAKKDIGDIRFIEIKFVCALDAVE